MHSGGFDFPGAVDLNAPGADLWNAAAIDVTVSGAWRNDGE